MEGLSVTAILKIVAEHGVLGIGWIAWILQVINGQVERKRYQALVVHIIQHFTKSHLAGDDESDSKVPTNTFTKLFGKD